MPNFRLVRDQGSLPDFVTETLRRYVLGAGGNYAILFVNPPDGQAVDRTLDLRETAYGAVIHVNDDGYVIIGRNISNAEHSEIVCIRAFEQEFRRRGGDPAAPEEQHRVKYVFSEREPCHGGPFNCTRSLEDFLERHGVDGRETMVRYLTPYENVAEVDTIIRMRTSARRAPAHVVEQNRAERRAEMNRQRRIARSTVVKARRGLEEE
jgi:hypothetical protein